jgi:tetratricopeptide (TPR) repeat protein
MPPTGGEGGAGRPSHRFAASNLGVALLSGDDAQVAAVEAFGAGAVTVDLVAALLGEAAATTTMAPLAGAAVPAGTSLRLDVVVATPGAGHYWPGGKLDLSDSWLELVGRDADGEVLFTNGATGDGPVDRAAHRFGLRLIDQDLEPLTHGETWHARSEIFRRWVLPLGAEVVHYRLTVPAELAPGGSNAGELHLTARLMSRQPSGDLDAWVREQGAPEASQALPEPTPLVRGEATASLEVLAADAEPRPGAAPTADDWRRFNDYGIGLFLQGDTRGARAAFERVTELVPEDADGWLNLAWTAMSGGDLAAMEEALSRAEELVPELARTVFFRARYEQQRGDPEAAIAAFERAIEAYPYDRVTRAFLLQVLMAQGDHEAALEQIGEILAVDPEYSLAHYNAMLAHRALGEEEKAEHHRLRYERFRVDDAARTLSGAYLETDADDNRERQAIHEHAVSPRRSPAAGGEEQEEGR